MASSGGTGLLTYNGEIYNASEIRKELEQIGIHFNTHHSDSEVVLNAYLAWSVNCLRKFRGMFAFAALDDSTHRVILARDRLGKKPLFYTICNGYLWFSSELEALWRTIGPFQLNLAALNKYLCWQYVPGPETI